MKRLWILFLCAVCVLLVCGCKSESSSIEDFEYEIMDGEVSITGYVGTDRDIYIPEMIEQRPVTVVGDHAFEGYDLKKIVFPESLLTIGESAFEDCVCLEEIQFSKSILYINSNAFRNCDTLKNVDLPENLLTLGASTFTDCDSLEFLQLPENNVMEIEERGGIYYLFPPIYDDDATVLVVPRDSDTEKVIMRFTSDDETISSWNRHCDINYVVEDVGGSKENNSFVSSLIDKFSNNAIEYPTLELNGEIYYYGMLLDLEDGCYTQDDGSIIGINEYYSEDESHVDVSLIARIDND